MCVSNKLFQRNISITHAIYRESRHVHHSIYSQMQYRIITHLTTRLSLYMWHTWTGCSVCARGLVVHMAEVHVEKMCKEHLKANSDPYYLHWSTLYGNAMYVLMTYNVYILCMCACTWYVFVCVHVCVHACVCAL